jgi:hypothetical protein
MEQPVRFAARSSSAARWADGDRALEVTTLRSSRDTAFLATIAGWIESRSEVLVMFRWPNAAGSKSFEFFQDVSAFMARLEASAQRTSVIVFREPQLPLRGLIDEDFIRRAVNLVPESTGYLIAGLDRITMGNGSWYPESAGESYQELIADLRDWWPGHRVAVGPYPEWLQDNEGVLSAYIPDADGTVRPAAY